MAVALYNGGLYSDDPILDESHHQARAYGECAKWLDYLASEQKAPRTRADYERTVAKLLRNNPDVEFHELTTDHLVTALASHPPGSRRPVRAHLQSFFAWGVLMEHIERNPMERVPRVRAQKQKVIDIFSDVEIALLESGPIHIGIIFTLLFECGLRRSEIIKLQRRHIDLTRRHVIVYDGKGGKDRLIKFGDHMAQRVADFDLIERLNPDDHIVWTKPGGKGMSRKKASTAAGFHEKYGEWVRDAGVRYRNPHVCRHTFAVNWLREGGRLEVLKKQMGHSSISTTSDLYAHLDESDAGADIERIDAYRAARAEA